MTRMHNPTHSEKVLSEYSGDVTVTEVAVRLGDKRVILTRLLDGTTCTSPDIAHRLGDATDTSPKLRTVMQMKYDLYQAGRPKRAKVELIVA